MKKRVLVLALLIAAGMLGVCALAFGLIIRKSDPKVWATESPNKTYRVTFKGSSSPRSWPFTEPAHLQDRRVEIAVSRNGTTIVDHAVIYDGDAYDSSFGDLYPTAEWVSESILHLTQKNRVKREIRPAKEISIKNESGERVGYLYIRAGKTNVFLLFDTPLATKITLYAQLEHWEDLVGCEGKFDTRDFPYRSADFSLSSENDSPPRYGITIKKDGCSVTGEK